MMNNKWSKEEALEHMRQNANVEMELYYEDGYGFMMVESEAVDNTSIFSPYTQEKYADSE